MPKLMYISGPYTQSDALVAEHNLNLVRECAVWCAEHNLYSTALNFNSAYMKHRA